MHGERYLIPLHHRGRVLPVVDAKGLLHVPLALGGRDNPGSTQATFNPVFPTFGMRLGHLPAEVYAVRVGVRIVTVPQHRDDPVDPAASNGHYRSSRGRHERHFPLAIGRPGQRSASAHEQRLLRTGLYFTEPMPTGPSRRWLRFSVRQPCHPSLQPGIAEHLGRKAW